MDNSSSRDLVRPQRHAHGNLPRHWISLPEPIRRAALTDPLLSGLFPSHVGYFRRAARHGIGRDSGIESHVFNYCIEGSGWCEISGSKHEVHAGDLMVAPAQTTHAYGTNPDDPWTVHWFHAMGTQVPTLLTHLGMSEGAPVLHLGRSAELESLFTEVRKALEDDYTELSLLYAAQVLHHLMGKLMHLARASSTHPDTAHRVQASLSHMKRHLSRSTNVSELASGAGLSPSHYSALVRRATGYSPMEYLTRLRLHRAAQLLNTTSASVSAIAREVGYADPLHFSRAFRQVHELSPRQYRKRSPGSN